MKKKCRLSWNASHGGCSAGKIFSRTRHVCDKTVDKDGRHEKSHVCKCGMSSDFVRVVTLWRS